MDSLIYTLFVCIFIPQLLLALMLEKKSRFPMIFALIGMYIALLVSEFNGFLLSVLDMDTYQMTITVTPVTEELFKAIPVLFFAVVISDKREKLLAGAMAIGIGFAILENTYYMLGSDSFTMIHGIMRAFGSGLMHGMCTMIVGVGISFVKKRRKTFIVGTFAMLYVAIVYHSVYNILIQSRYMIIGLFIPIITYIPFLVWKIVKVKKNEML